MVLFLMGCIYSEMKNVECEEIFLEDEGCFADMEYCCGRTGTFEEDCWYETNIQTYPCAGRTDCEAAVENLMCNECGLCQNENTYYASH